MANDAQLKDRRGYTVHGLYAAGSRFTDDYDEADAVADYLELHPEADPVAVRAELDAEIARFAALSA